MSALLALALAYAGFTALALAMDRHHKQVWHRPVSGLRRNLLRTAGVIDVGASFAACVMHAGWSIGAVQWLGLLSVAGLSVVLQLTYWPCAVHSTAPSRARRVRT